jgi:hypothetical protein
MNKNVSKVKFRCICQTELGEAVRIVGSATALGILFHFFKESFLSL